MQLYLWEAAPAPSALSVCNCSAEFMEAITKRRHLGVQADERSLAFTQHLAGHGAAPCARADRYVPKPLLPPGKYRLGTCKKAQ